MENDKQEKANETKTANLSYLEVHREKRRWEFIEQKRPYVLV